MFSFQNCTRVAFKTMSNAESLVRKADVFAGGVESIDGKIPSENLRVTSIEQAEENMVTDCSQPGLREKERAEAVAAAVADKSNKTIPVAYAISLGNVNDGMAYWAHKRAVLSEDNDGKSYIAVGPLRDHRYIKDGVDQPLYYIVNHDQAKVDFVKGKKCFFSTVKVEEEHRQSATYFDFIQGSIPSGLGYNRHNVH